MIVRVETIEQARRKFLVVHGNAARHWRCTTCGWCSTRTTAEVPEPHECRGTIGPMKIGPRFGEGCGQSAVIG